MAQPYIATQRGHLWNTGTLAQMLRPVPKEVTAGSQASRKGRAGEHMSVSTQNNDWKCAKLLTVVMEFSFLPYPFHIFHVLTKSIIVKGGKVFYLEKWGGGYLFIYLSFFWSFRAARMAFGGSQARGQIGDVSASHSHSYLGSEPCL